METIRAALEGKKTYIVAAILIATAVLAWVNGEASLFESAEAILVALGLGFVRAGVKTDTGAA